MYCIIHVYSYFLTFSFFINVISVLSLSFPQHHMVVKAAIDLLLVFVNYTDPSEACSSKDASRLESPDSLPPNALLFKDAVEEVSDDKGIPLWSFLLSIVSEKSVADQDIMTKAMSLINRVWITDVCMSLINSVKI